MARRKVEDSAVRLYTPGEAAKLLGIAVSTQKYWESAGYLLESKMAGTHRRYTEEHLRRLLRVKLLTERYRYRERVLAALAAGEEADPLLPWDAIDVDTCAQKQAAELDLALDLAARYAALFAEEHRLVKRLRAVEQKYLILTGIITEMVIVMDLSGLVYGVNAAARCYGDPNAMVGSPLARYLSTGSAKDLRVALNCLLANRVGTEELTVEWIMEKERSFTLLLSMSPIMMGDCPFVLCVARKQSLDT